MKSRLSALLLFLILATLAQAQGLDLLGNVAWLQNKSRIRIEAGVIRNDSGVTSGLLRLQIWATTEPYNEVDDITGYVIGSATLPRLRNGDERRDVVKRVRYRRPPAGYYYTTITLEEKRGTTWYIVDSENFRDAEENPSLVNLGGFGEGLVTLEKSSSSLLTFLGDVYWQVGNGRAIFEVERIVNDAANRSGNLRVQLYASTNGYDPEQTFYAYPMAKKTVGRLSGGGSQRSFYPKSTSYRPPPPGGWFITITLEEYDRGWVILDYYNFQDLRYF